MRRGMREGMGGIWGVHCGLGMRKGSGCDVIALSGALIARKLVASLITEYEGVSSFYSARIGSQGISKDLLKILLY
ncbi:unnamed protein product [Danaus chrysippus]|uniref:(African queen) hypothetical protein n=1 Tax=Danaus chrysippus TaxID=151541 RepID=A0A8J2R2W6_9NEOP|nr:unnamed protein product [Danaus chrysippus]